MRQIISEKKYGENMAPITIQYKNNIFLAQQFYTLPSLLLQIQANLDKI